MLYHQEYGTHSLLASELFDYLSDTCMFSTVLNEDLFNCMPQSEDRAVEMTAGERARV
jgi:hypothetical protein